MDDSCWLFVIGYLLLVVGCSLLPSWSPLLRGVGGGSGLGVDCCLLFGETTKESRLK